jgi:hypothetical protein
MALSGAPSRSLFSPWLYRSPATPQDPWWVMLETRAITF